MSPEDAVITRLMAKKKPSGDRRSLKANLSKEEMDRFTAAHEPVSQADALALLVQWFIDQDEVVQKEILGLLPEKFRPSIARAVLEQMVEGEIPAVTGHGKVRKRSGAGQARETAENGCT